MIRCSKGHYYDESKYMLCPYCGIYEEDDDIKTQYISTHEDMEDNEKRVKSEKKSGFFRLHKMSNTAVDVKHETDCDDVKTISGVGLTQANYVAGWLVCIDGEDKGRDYRIYRGRNFLGRDYGMDIRIENDDAVSRINHCAIIYEPRQSVFYVKPMENMVYMDGKMIGQTEEIKSGDEIQIGNSTFVFIAFCGEDRKWED